MTSLLSNRRSFALLCASFVRCSLFFRKLLEADQPVENARPLFEKHTVYFPQVFEVFEYEEFVVHILDTVYLQEK